MDAFADHALTCRVGEGGVMGSWKSRRHDEVVGILNRLAVAAGFHVVQEKRECDSNRRPGDIHVVRDGGGMEGRYKGRFTSDHAFGECSYDVTVTATQKISNGAFGYSSAAGGAGHAASVAHREKVAKYKDQVAGWSVGRNRFRRVELAFESFGFA